MARFFIDRPIFAWVIALVIMGLGTGLFKANISPLVAEQYTKNKLFIRVKSDGSRVIVDPAFTVSRVYMVSTCGT